MRLGSLSSCCSNPNPRLINKALCQAFMHAYDTSSQPRSLVLCFHLYNFLVETCSTESIQFVQNYSENFLFFKNSPRNKFASSIDATQKWIKLVVRNSSLSSADPETSDFRLLKLHRKNEGLPSYELFHSSLDEILSMKPFRILGAMPLCKKVLCSTERSRRELGTEFGKSTVGYST